jgi:hypothetical protein
MNKKPDRRLRFLLLWIGLLIGALAVSITLPHPWCHLLQLCVAIVWFVVGLFY